jgi:hypothetical protein
VLKRRKPMLTCAASLRLHAVRINGFRPIERKGTVSLRLISYVTFAAKRSTVSSRDGLIENMLKGLWPIECKESSADCARESLGSLSSSWRKW